MKNCILHSVFFAFISISVFGQDQLFKKDNSKLDVKVLEINPTQIKYKLKTNADGPTYIVNKNEVALIIYQNGDHEAFKDEAPVQYQQPSYIPPRQNRFYMMDSLRAQKARGKIKNFEEVTKAKNVIFYNMAELFDASIGLSYFREFAKNLLDVQVPISFSVGEPYMHNLVSSGIYNTYNVYNYKTTQKAIDIGLGVYINTSGKKAVTHFIGPLFRMAQYNGLFRTFDYNILTYDQWGNAINKPVYGTHGFVLNETYFMLNNGLLFRLSPHFNLMINAAFGMVASHYYVANDPIGFQVGNYYNVPGNYYNSYTNTPTFQFGFNFGYRF